MSVRSTIEAKLVEALGKFHVHVSGATYLLVQHTNDLKNGDYTSGAAMMHAKQLEKKPLDLADALIQELGQIDGVAKIEIAGPGFINFYLASNELAATVNDAVSEDMWGSNHELKGKKIMVEFTDPNPFKELHIGHLMSNAIGESISRLLEFSGADVKRANYQGDVGLHVAKAIHGMQMAKDKMPSDDAPLNEKAFFLGMAYSLGAGSYEATSEWKNEIDALNKVIYEKSNDEVNKLYEWGRKVSLDYFETLYEKLGMQKRDHFGKQMHFDFYFFESMSWEIGKVIVEQNTPKVFEESDGAIVFHGEKVDPSLHTRVFITSKKLPTYEAKELGLLKSKIDKWGWDFEESITITAHEQADYFRVVLAAASQIEELSAAAKKTRHISHGMMRLPTGKMSSRTGDVITGLGLLQDLIDVAKKRAAESRAEDKDKLALQIALGAFKYQILKQASGKDIIFEKERALSLEGDSGPYLQYAHARTHAIVEKAAQGNITPRFDEQAPVSDLARLLHRFPEVVARASREREPHHVTTYLLEVAAMFNRWYAQEQILDRSPAQAHKVALTSAVNHTLKNGLWILGIPAPNKM